MSKTDDPIPRVVASLKKVLPARFHDVSILRETRFQEDLSMDSLNFLEFLVALEEEFRVDLTADVLRVQSLRSVDDVVKLLDQLGAEAR